jgi:hypothetical protein
LSRGDLLVEAPGYPGLSTPFSRRALLQAGGVAGVLAALGLGGAARLTRGVVIPAYLRRETYEPLVGRWFAVAGTHRSLQLVAVERIRHSTDGFSLLFRLRRGARPLGPVLRGVRHPAVGSADLVLLAVGRGVHGQSYQSIVNRDPVAEKRAKFDGQ